MDLDLELIREFLVLLSDYVERQFHQLGSNSVLRFYEAFFKMLKLLTFHFQDKAETYLQNSQTIANISIMVTVLQLLDNLAIQEFCVPSIQVMESFLGSDLLMGEEIHISEVVGVGLILFSRVWSNEMLEYYCDLQKAYFSLLLYTLSSSANFLIWMDPSSGNSSSGSSSTVKLFLSIGMNENEILHSLNTIYSSLIWGMTSGYPSTPRQAMQGIQHCAIVGIKSPKTSDSCVELLTRFIWHCQETFLLYLCKKFQPSSPLPYVDDPTRKVNILSWDRVDTIASTFLAVIAFDVQRFLHSFCFSYFPSSPLPQVFESRHPAVFESTRGFPVSGLPLHSPAEPCFQSGH